MVVTEKTDEELVVEATEKDLIENEYEEEGNTEKGKGGDSESTMTERAKRCQK
ncbi:hypothetical protein U1Q18_002030, partial [Sarracenia purpurea var. burkii]